MKKFYKAAMSLVFFSLFVVVTNSGQAQTASLSLSDTTACPGDEITIKLMAENLLNVGAISLYIGYDTTVLEFDGYGNVHPQFAGLIANAVTAPATQVNLAWSSLTAGNLSSGTLVELYFIYNGGASDLTFNPGGDITGVNLLPIPFTTEDGSASIGPPYIIENPENTVVTTGTNATFSVTAEGATTWQWQEFDGSDWNDLQNSATYQNVDGPQLTIVQTPLDLDGYWYRCFMTAGACEAMSDSAMLTVLPELTAMLTLPSTGSCPGQEIAVPLQGFALDDVIEFGFYISYNPSVATFTGLANVQPAIEGVATMVNTSPIHYVHIFWSAAIGVSIEDGVLFELVFNFNQGNTALIFMDQSFVLNSAQFSYNLSTINGQITTYAVPVITSQPSDLTIYAGSEATFTVEATGAERYQWFESQDGGTNWDMLQEIDPYSGVQTSVLTISNVPVAFDQFRYKCLVSSANCDEFSQSALLSVDTLSWVSAPVRNENRFVIEGYQLQGNVLHLELHIPEPGLLSIRLYDLGGRLTQMAEHKSNARGRQRISLELSGPQNGMKLINCLLQGKDGNVFITTGKIMPLR